MKEVESQLQSVLCAIFLLMIKPHARDADRLLDSAQKSIGRLDEMLMDEIFEMTKNTNHIGD